MLSADTMSGADPPRPRIDRSLRGRRWVLREVDERHVMALAQRLSVPTLVARVLVARGIDLETADAFLKPTLKAQLPDPSLFKDMDTAAERLARAIENGEAVAIFGDYDVDGATSSALLARYLRAVEATVSTYIPDRLKEGYGPNTAALLNLRAEGAAVVVTVDCGISAHEPLAAAAEAGLDVIVVDHHMAPSRLPKACAVVNPNRLDESGEFGYLAAVGVAFLLTVAVNRALRRRGYFASRSEPDLRQWLDLVALGTVCDMVPLKGLNRVFAAQGIRVMGGRSNPGLRALADVAGLDQPPGGYHLGFVFGPRINAGGRVGEAGLGAALLATELATEAADIAQRLDGFNRERQQIEKRVLQEALVCLSAADRPEKERVIVVAGAGWHPGVVGIVASRLVECFHRPACVVALDGETGTGSARSVPGFDIGAAIAQAARQGILERGGGHPMAGGFAIARENVGAFRHFLADQWRERAGAGAERANIMEIDALISPRGLRVGLLDSLARLEPYGAGNAEPRFLLQRVRIESAGVAAGAHVRCKLTGEDGASVDAIAFRAVDTPLGEAMTAGGRGLFHVVGRLQRNVFRGYAKPQFVIDDAVGA